jgi:hypothetical protein
MIRGDCTSHQTVLLYIPEVADVDADVDSVRYEHVLAVLTADSAEGQMYRVATVPGTVDKTDGDDVARSSQIEEPARKIRQ